MLSPGSFGAMNQMKWNVLLSFFFSNASGKLLKGGRGINIGEDEIFCRLFERAKHNWGRSLQFKYNVQIFIFWKEYMIVKRRKRKRKNNERKEKIYTLYRKAIRLFFS